MTRTRTTIVAFCLLGPALGACYTGGGGGGDGSGDGSDVGADAFDGGEDDGSSADAISDATDAGDASDAGDADAVGDADVSSDANADADASDADADGSGELCGRGMVPTEAGDGCELGSWPYNGDFLAEDGWILSGAATIETEVQSNWLGSVEGALQFEGAEGCVQVSTASQTIPFSGVPRAGIGYTVDTDTACDFDTGSACPGPRIWVNGRLANLSTGEANIDERTYDTGCIPASSVGRDLELVLASDTRGRCDWADSLIDWVQVSTTADWMCPSEAGIRDGGFDGELDAGAWRNLDTASIVEVLGNRALSLPAAPCVTASADQVISVSDDISAPSLVADVDIPAGSALTVFLPGGRHDFGAGVTSVAMCLDPGVPLTRQAISFRAEAVSDDCESVAPAPVRVDNVRIVDDPSCANVGGVTAGTFDGIGSELWKLYAWSLPEDHATAEIYEPEAGARVLRLTGGTDCFQTTASILVGGPNAAPHGALRFDYRVLRGEATIEAKLLGETINVVGAPLWATHEHCLDAWSPYTATSLEFTAYNVAACSGSPQVLSRSFVVEFDNVAIVTSDACP